MKVYILYCYDYEHYETLGVFDTAEAAHAVRRALGYKQCAVSEYELLSTPAQSDIVIEATVNHSWKATNPALYDKYDGRFSYPTVQHPDPLDVVDFCPSESAAGASPYEYNSESWSVVSRSALRAVALLREALGSRWTKQLEDDFTEELLDERDRRGAKLR